MTTQSSETINLYEEELKQLPRVLCQCHSRGMVAIKDEKIAYWGQCVKHHDQKEFARSGYEFPKFHPLYPKAFRDTKLEMLNPKMLDAINWVPTLQKSGMLMHGTSGIGKTRAAWYWTNRAWLNGTQMGINLGFHFYSMMDLEEKLSSSFSDNKHSQNIKAICKAPLLVIDDFGKERMTSRMATDLFAVIDQRTMNQKATIITTNFNGQGLIDRFMPSDKETAIALVRRLRDYFSIYGMGQ